MHGWGGNQDSLISVANSLSKEFRVTLVDFYGFGQTPHPEYPLTIFDYLNGLYEIINYYKMSHVILIGHSFGGRVAILAAARFGHLFDRIVLIDSAGVKPRRKPIFYIKILKAKIYKHVLKKQAKGSSDYQQLTGFKRKTFVNIVNCHLDEYLKFITLPTLIIWGKNDKDTPLYMAKRLKRGIANSRLCVLNQAGHFSYIDKPHECLAEIKQFLGGYKL